MGVLVGLVHNHPNERVALSQLDEVNRLREPRENGDSEWIGNLKIAASQLRAAAATAMTIVDNGRDLRLCRVYGQVSGSGHTWGPISSVSCHSVALGAAHAMLETGNVMTELVLRSAKAPRQWEQLKNDLASEQERVLLVAAPDDTERPAPPPEKGPPPQAQDAGPSNRTISSGSPGTASTQASPYADTRQLVGWREILPVLGYEPKGRQPRELVKRLNESTNGPIKKRGTRGRIANRGELLAWWKTVAERAEQVADERARSDKDSQKVDAHVSNPGVAKEMGLQSKQRPNTNRRPDR